MFKILIPVDFSENTLKSCKYALNLANSKNSEIQLINILPEGIMVPDSSFPAGIDSDAFFNKEYLENLYGIAKSNMEKLTQKLEDFLKNTNKNVSVKYNIVRGDAEWEILNVCETFSPELIVMGTSGTGNKGVLQGSMAKKIMNKVKVPVIAVPTDCTKIQPSNILYATNFDENDYRKLKLLHNLFKRLDTKIYVTHFDFDGKNLELTDKINNLRQAFAEERKMGKMFFNIIDSVDKDISLRAFCEEYDIDLVSFISYKSNIFHQIFSNELHKKDFFKLNLPMLALHD